MMVTSVCSRRECTHKTSVAELVFWSGLFAHLEVEGLRIRKKNDGSALFSDQEAVL